jgi:hypothetical protein
VYEVWLLNNETAHAAPDFFLPLSVLPLNLPSVVCQMTLHYVDVVSSNNLSVFLTYCDHA